MPRANAIQDKWMNEVRNTIRDSNIAEPVFRYPPLEYFGGSSVPEVDRFYLKPLIVCAPHKNFPNIKIPCNRCTDGVFEPYGWESKDQTRYIHGLSNGFYVLQYRYCCDNSSCPRNANKKNKEVTRATEILEFETTPDVLRVALRPFYLTQRCGFDSKLFEYIMTESLTRKTFEDIAHSIEAYRRNEYLRRRALYAAAIAHYCSGPLAQKQPTDFTQFSAFDAEDGYNEELGPSSTYIIETFKGKKRTLIVDKNNLITACYYHKTS
jgi:hypothetical protein